MTFFAIIGSAKRLEKQRTKSLLFSNNLLDETSKLRLQLSDTNERTKCAERVMEIRGISERIRTVSVISPEKQKKIEKRLIIETLAGAGLGILGLAGIAIGPAVISSVFSAIAVAGGITFAALGIEIMSVIGYFRRERNILIMAVADLMQIKDFNSSMPSQFFRSLDKRPGSP